VLASGFVVVLENVAVLICFDDSEDLLGIFLSLIEETFPVNIRDLKGAAFTLGYVVFDVLIYHLLLVE
jgi:hypothetical protein